MLFVYVAAARLSVTSGASPPFHRNWDDSKTTQQKHYVGATSCHAISVHVINLPTHLYCITYWLADNLGRFSYDQIRHRHRQPRHQLLHPPPQRWNDSSLRQRNCSSPSLQMAGVKAAVPALVPRCMPKSTNTCQRKMPSPSGGDGRQHIHSLPHLHKT